MKKKKEEHWWSYLEPYLLKKLEEYRPDYKTLSRPDLDIRWRLEEWEMDEMVKYGKIDLNAKKYTKEELEEHLRLKRLWHKQHGNWRMPDDWDGKS